MRNRARKRGHAMPAQFSIAESVRSWLSECAKAAEMEDFPELKKVVSKGEATVRQAETIARRLHISLADLLSESPREPIPLPAVDKRCGREKPHPESQRKLEELIESALVKQSWMARRRQLQGLPPSPLVPETRAPAIGPGRLPLAKPVAAFLAHQLGIPKGTAPCFDRRRLTERCEALGVLVLATGHVGSNTRRTIDPGEIRGFCLADRWAPVIFVNTSDAENAQVFTICHELAHLALGHSVISDPEIIPHRDQDAEESFCNQVAARLLMPERTVRDVWQTQAQLDIESRLAETARRLRVSKLALAIRLKTLKLVSAPEADRLIAQVRAASSRRREANRGDPYASARNANSRTFTSAVLHALEADEITYREARDLLGVSYKVLLGLLDRFGPLTSGGAAKDEHIR